MKIGYRGSDARRSTPYGNDPVRARIMAGYTNYLEQYQPQAAVEENENNLLPEQSFQREAS